MAFYLLDSAVLLYADQLIVERQVEHWRPRRGSPMLLAGRRPFLPNPLTPQRAMLMISLEQLLSSDSEEKIELEPMLQALAPLSLLVRVLLLLFVGMPVILYFTGTGNVFLAWFACVYVTVLLMTGLLWRRRKALGLSARSAAVLVFECIACSPMAINIIRHITLRAATPNLEDVRRLMDAKSFCNVTDAIREMLKERELEVSPEGPAMERLFLFRQRLEAGATK